MTIDITEHFESQEVTRNFETSTMQLKAIAMGDEDTWATETAFISWLGTHPETSGADLETTHLIHLGGGVHECTASYAITHNEIAKTIRYRTTGASARVLTAWDHIGDYGDTTNKYNGLINVNSDGTVEGVDIPIPTFSFSIDYRFSSVSAAYLHTCAELTGCVGSTTYLGYTAGELLFTGIEGEIGMTSGGAIVLGASPISFNFEVSPNRTSSFTIPGTSGAITIPSKYGWDYLWVSTLESTVGTKKARKTVSAHLDRVHRWADLSALGI